MQLLSYNGVAVAVAGATRVWLAPAIDDLPCGDPLRRFVAAMCLYALDVRLELVPGPYSDQRAELYARCLLLCDRAIAALSDAELSVLPSCYSTPGVTLPCREELKRPHVASLSYKLKAADPLLDFTGTAFPKEAELGRFSCRVEEEQVTVIPRDHFAEPEEAEAAFELELRAWQSYGEIVTGVRFGFSLETAKVIDLAEPEGARDESGYQTVRLELEVRYNVNWSPEIFPDPPRFPYVETEAISRLKRVLRGQRGGDYPLLGAAEDIRTDLEVRYGGGNSNEAADRLNVSHNVLDELGRLCTSNDPVHRRALKNKPGVGPLSDEQVGWVSRLLPELVARAARIEANAPDAAQLTMDRV